LQDLLAGLLSQKGVKHAVMAVETVDGSFRWGGAVGVATPDGRRMQETTPFFIASVDKLFTATVVLKLCERGDISLETPISGYLPDTLVSGIHRMGGIDYSGRITVRHLLTHTSGLPDWLEDRPKGGRSLFERLTDEGDMALSTEGLLRTVAEELVSHFPPQPSESRRKKARYCDTNFILLVAIIEAVTGQKLHQVHEELLFRPLKMRQTWLAGHSKPLDPAPEPAVLWAGDMPLEIPRLMRSTWGIYSTARDMLRLLRAVTTGAVFDHPSTPGLMQSDWRRFGLPLDAAALRSPSWPIEYGLGIMRFHDPFLKFLARLPRLIRPMYPAPAVVGHSGSTGSWLFHCPDLDLLLSGTVDQAAAGSAPYRFMPKILKATDRWLPRMRPADATGAGPPDTLAQRLHLR
jgi:CubicO group peptidase (beta-lactamase class C family)